MAHPPRLEEDRQLPALDTARCRLRSCWALVHEPEGCKAGRPGLHPHPRRTSPHPAGKGILPPPSLALPAYLFFFCVFLCIAAPGRRSLPPPAPHTVVREDLARWHGSL
ncbi:hypothetical protein I4F81_010777 [Pyropia yezoensis]|uniref:Uncharacterized protein n=1 Tax=Pyropia yezoensis TaxID=2788 RepID=A0ACC3CDX3_PYRYE|nr:hypothetical protein I4F81_010777 [Neopyropia yezoensis]